MDNKKDKSVFWELVELDQKLATSGSKTNRVRVMLWSDERKTIKTEILIKSELKENTQILDDHIDLARIMLCFNGRKITKYWNKLSTINSNCIFSKDSIS